MFVATWNQLEVARSDRCICVENALYFPFSAVRHELLRPSGQTSACEWKGGTARYFDIVDDGGSTNHGAAWTYPNTSSAAKPIEGWFAFWRGVEVRREGLGGRLTHLRHVIPNVAKALGADDVNWRPDVPLFGSSTNFDGYLIPSLGVLVDVLAEPHSRAERVWAKAAARLRAIEVTHSDDADIRCYIATWGSAVPSEAAIDALGRGHSVLDLDAVPEVVERHDTDSTLAGRPLPKT